VPRYAEGTSVSPDRSRSEIERVLTRYGATGFGYMWQGLVAMIVFEMQGRRIRITLQMPSEEEFRYTATYRTRTTGGMREACEQARRQRWRALALYVKATCEAIEAGIVKFEDVWLAQTVLPSGATVGEWIEPQLDDVYRSGQMPPLLPAPKSE
jgi:predicted DNA-binding protein